MCMWKLRSCEVEAENKGALEVRAESLYVESSGVIAMYDQGSKFEVAPRRASGLWCGGEGSGSERGLRCLCFRFRECGEIAKW